MKKSNERNYYNFQCNIMTRLQHAAELKTKFEKMWRRSSTVTVRWCMEQAKWIHCEYGQYDFFFFWRLYEEKVYRWGTASEELTPRTVEKEITERKLHTHRHTQTHICTHIYTYMDIQTLSQNYTNICKYTHRHTHTYTNEAHMYIFRRKFSKKLKIRAN